MGDQEEHHTHITCPLLQPVFQWVAEHSNVIHARLMIGTGHILRTVEASSGSKAAAKEASGK
jgi:hypothetical protein